VRPFLSRSPARRGHRSTRRPVTPRVLAQMTSSPFASHFSNVSPIAGSRRGRACGRALQAPVPVGVAWRPAWLWASGPPRSGARQHHARQNERIVD
jgi:hypothetical protein